MISSKIKVTVMFLILQAAILLIYFNAVKSKHQEPSIEFYYLSNKGNSQTSNNIHVITYAESIKRVQQAIDESIYLFNRTFRLPLLKMTAKQLNRTFRIQETRKWLKSQRLVVASAVRNAMSGLNSSVMILRQLSNLFQSVTAVFIENDSTDDTRKYLHEIAQNSTDEFRVLLLGCGTINSPDPCRINISYGSSGRLHAPGHWEQAKRDLAEESIDRGLVMAALRNIYMQFIYDRVDGELLLVLESDLKWNDWDMDNIAQGLFHFKSNQKLDSLCAFTLLLTQLHDPCTLIFFHNKYFYVDSEEIQSPFVDRLGNTNKFFEKHLNIPRSKSQDVPQQPVKVASCFQGATFYRLSSLRAASAFYKYSREEWHCEHSTLSRQLKENYLDTQMMLIFQGQNVG